MRWTKKLLSQISNTFLLLFKKKCNAVVTSEIKLKQTNFFSFISDVVTREIKQKTILKQF